MWRLETTTETWCGSFLDAVKSISLNALSHEPFLSVTTMQQLDIFADSRDVALRNDVVEQLQRRDAAAARAALTLLAREYATDSALSAVTVFVGELENVATLAVTDHAELDAICRHLEGEVVPAARQVLSEQNAQSWMAPCWLELAQRCRTLARTRTVTPHLYGFGHATGLQQPIRSTRLNPGGAFHHHSPG